MQMEISKIPEQPPISTNLPLQKLASFIDYHDIPHTQIWNSQSHISIIQFISVMQQKYGYQVTADQLLALRHISGKEGQIYPENFHELGIWKSAIYEIHRPSKKMGKEKIRPQTAKQFEFSRIGKMGEQTRQQQSHIINQYHQTQNNQIYENSRLKEEKQKLEKKIIENALDKKWQYVIKVGEMNNWLKILGQNQLTNHFQHLEKENQSHYRLSKKLCKLYKIYGDNQNIQIIQQKEDGTQQTLPLKVFDQKYQSMKKRCTTQQKLKNNMKGTMLLVLDKKQKVSKTKLGEKISQRDQQLNYLLLEIMRLKNIFEQQEQILNDYGVNC